MIRKINELRAFASSEYSAEKKSKGGIKKATKKTQKEKTYEASNSIIKNALMLYDNRAVMIQAFETRNVLPEDAEEKRILE